jgi:polyisoprenyl-teichoic acid--peptidoglycan teichoic acid transferase
MKSDTPCSPPTPAEESSARLGGCLRKADRWKALRSLFWFTIPVLAITLWLGWLASGWDRPITLLLLGSDSRDPENPGRSDAIVVLRADLRSGTLRGLSLPRDLYVPISGIPVKRTGRLNSALFFGDYYAASEGINAARQTVSELIEVPVDGAVVVNVDLVGKIVDALGGVEVYCDKPAYDAKFNPFRGGKPYPLRFESGWNFLNGKRALEFVRLRRPDTDFGRMNRNRELLSAVSQRLRSPSGCVRFPLIVPDLWREIRTDVGPIGSLRVLWAMARCSAGGIRWNAIDRNNVLPYVTPRGAQVLLAEPGILRDAGRILTGEQPVNLAGASASPESDMAQP